MSETASRVCINDYFFFSGLPSMAQPSGEILLAATTIKCGPIDDLNMALLCHFASMSSRCISISVRHLL